MSTTDGHPDIVADLERAVAAVQPLADHATPERLADPTPCEGWDIRTLLNHIVTGNVWFAGIVTGDPPPDRTQDHLGDNPAAAYRNSGQAMAAAFRRPEVMGTIYPSPIGDVPGSVLVHMRINETLVHGWDLARALGAPADLPADLVEHTLAMWRERIGDSLRQPGGPFGPQQPVSDDAPAADRLAAFLGRKVD
jgi:uncharacterized protein (TIGR03086 family)